MFITVLHHVALSWIFESNQQLEYDIDKHNPNWFTNGTWYNTYICTKLNGTVFEKYIRNARTDRYNLMCYIDAHEKQKPSYFDDGSSGGGKSIPSNSTTESLDSLGEAFYLIGFWQKCFDQNYQA